MVTIGPYCVIGEHVSIGRGTRLVAQVYIEGVTHIGERCQIYPFASIGTPPQHLQFGLVCEAEMTALVTHEQNATQNNQESS